MKPNLRIILLFLGVYFISINYSLAQKFTGYVLDFDTQKPIEMVNVVLARTQEGSLSDGSGKFEIKVQLYDTLVFTSMNYELKKVVITKLSTQYFLLKEKTHHINEVKVEAKDDVPNMYKSSVFPDKDPHPLNVIVHPASYLFFKLSKKEKSKRKVRDEIDYRKRMERVFTIYTIDLVAEFTGFSGDELNECFMYCTAHIDLDENDTEFSIKYKLLEILAKYNESKK